MSSAASSAGEGARRSVAPSGGAASSSEPENSDEESVVSTSEAEGLGDKSDSEPSPLLDTGIAETAEDVNNNEESLEITALRNTTSLHDDWLHRGAFLADLDLHTYIAHVVRIPRPTKARVSDIERCEHVFLFDDHYELAK